MNAAFNNKSTKAQNLYSLIETGIKLLFKKKKLGVLIYGDSGLGKTKKVRKILADYNNENLCVKAYFQSYGDLYKTLYKDNDKVIAFDEADNLIVKSSKFHQLVLNSVDKTTTKRILYYKNKQDPDLKNGDYPQHFIYTGRLIFITNKKKSQILPALFSRCFTINMSLSNQDVIEELEASINSFNTEYSIEMKKTVLVDLKKNFKKIKKIDFRNFEDLLMIKEESNELYEIKLHELISNK